MASEITSKITEIIIVVCIQLYFCGMQAGECLSAEKRKPPFSKGGILESLGILPLHLAFQKRNERTR